MYDAIDVELCVRCHRCGAWCTLPLMQSLVYAAIDAELGNTDAWFE
jgi:hypothetical protein